MRSSQSEYPAYGAIAAASAEPWIPLAVESPLQTDSYSTDESQSTNGDCVLWFGRTIKKIIPCYTKVEGIIARSSRCNKVCVTGCVTFAVGSAIACTFTTGTYQYVCVALTMLGVFGTIIAVNNCIHP